jgi:protein-S-isoprenylcysteine O-methyltransferase Ste14
MWGPSSSPFRKARGTPAAVKPFETSVSLVLQGPFLFSRNPMYLGMAIVLAGIATLADGTGEEYDIGE